MLISRTSRLLGRFPYVGIKAGIHYPKDHIERMVDNRLSKIAMDDITKLSRKPESSSIRWY